MGAGDNSVDIETVREISESYTYYTRLREQRGSLVAKNSMLETMIERNCERVGVGNDLAEKEEEPNSEIISFADVLANPQLLRDEIDRLNTSIKKLGIRGGRLQRKRDELADRVDDLVRVDGLTGLYNKTEAYKRVTSEIERAKRDRQYVAVVMLDVDHFKLYNDSFGHPQGDNALRAVGEVLKTHTRKGDSAQRMEGNYKYQRDGFRYGGEEFIVVLTNISEEKVGEIVERLRKAIEESDVDVYNLKNQTGPYKFMTGKGPNSISASFGYVIYGVDEPYGQKGENTLEVTERLIQMADNALYAAKRDGRNTVRRWIPDEHSKAQA